MPLEKVGRIGRREALQIGGVADGGPVIRVRHERGAEKLLNQPPSRTAVGAHAALFHHHVALFVELAHHRMHHPVRLQRRPKLDLVRRQRVHVGGFVIAGERVHAHAAVAFHDLAELVFHHVFVGRRDGVLPGFFQLRQLLRVLPHALNALCLIRGIGLLDFFQRNFLRRVVGGADVGRALEGHVLHHVRQSGFVARVLRRPGVHQREERKHRRLGPLPQNHGQPVGQGLHRNPLFVGRQVLRSQWNSGRQQEQASQFGEPALHRSCASKTRPKLMQSSKLRRDRRVSQTDESSRSGKSAANSSKNTKTQPIGRARDSKAVFLSQL